MNYHEWKDDKFEYRAMFDDVQGDTSGWERLLALRLWRSPSQKGLFATSWIYRRPLPDDLPERPSGEWMAKNAPGYELTGVCADPSAIDCDGHVSVHPCGTPRELRTSGGPNYAFFQGNRWLLRKKQEEWVPWTPETFPLDRPVYVRRKDSEESWWAIDYLSLFADEADALDYFENFEQLDPDTREPVPCGVRGV